MLKQLKDEHISGKQGPRMAEAEAACGVRGCRGSAALHTTEEDCFPSAGFLRGSVLLGGDGAGEVYSA